MIRLKQVAKRFDNGMLALRELSFGVEAGQFVALLGPSGCGKSTILRLVAGLLKPDGGSLAYLHGRPEIGFVFQEPTLMPWADALTNARLPLDLKKLPRSQADGLAAAALEQVGLKGFERAYPRQLSGGMKMRVSIARALAAGPRLLLLDEPFAALDEITRDNLGEDLRKLWSEHALTILFVTHSVSESSYLSQRVLVMTPRPGRIFADIALPFGRDSRLAPATIESQRLISSALKQACAPAHDDVPT